MPRVFLPSPFKLLRIGSGFSLCAGTAGILVGLGLPLAAAGVGIGFGLYAVNLFFLYETARGLLERADSGGPRFLAAAASGGRLLFLGVVLSAVFLFLGRGALLGGCGGLFLSQVNLHFQGRLPKGEI